ncbi:MAG: coniferyl aldehyde dehydrogenase [Burkholderiaceae bacterium]|jgi:coniferyl-aldehyde dehydrogenase|nr:MAG: coniferyl aldehyde dehydrogenase [Burkholderiaceae bacterium]
MNDRTLAPDATRRIADLLAAQRAAFTARPYPSAHERRERLRALKRQIGRYQDRLTDAMAQDFGGRSADESATLDLIPTTLAINHALSHLARWMKPARRSTELLFLTNRLRVHYQPKGVVGVVATWNFPVYLSLGPLVAALAAGNRVMIKMPDVTPATNTVLRQLLAEVFDETEVALVGGELLDPSAFTALAFDHIVFTGSPTIGRAVMRQAAEHLTPVTLELGGKSPALVLRDYPLADAALRIAHGKGTNSGQICVAPDYALVPRDQLSAFAAEVKSSFTSLYGERAADNPDYTSIASDRHAARLAALLDDARAKGAEVTPCGPVEARRRMPLQIVTGCTNDMALMREEIFGPILPVVGYDTEDEAIRFIASRPRPLALYCFGRDAAARRQVLERTHSGGVTINDWGWHVVNHDAPFGGIGNSGMGSYHGVEGFRELSHARTVFQRQRFYPIGLFYPPYGGVVQRLARRLLLGKPDPAAGQPTPAPLNEKRP